MMDIKVKGSLVWSLLFFGLFFLNLYESINSTNRLCVQTPILLNDKLNCIGEEPIWFFLIVFSYIGPGIYFLFKSFK